MPRQFDTGNTPDKNWIRRTRLFSILSGRVQSRETRIRLADSPRPLICVHLRLHSRSRKVTSMSPPSKEYVLGQSTDAARRLEIQDLQFAAESELLLDEIDLRPSDRVVEIGAGAGGF